MTSSGEMTFTPVPEPPVHPGDGLEQAELPGVGTLWHADAERMARMAHTIMATEVPGMAYVVASSADGPLVRPVDYRQILHEELGPAYVDHTRTVRDPASFLAELRRRPLDPDASTITATESTNQVTAVYDDHPAGTYTGGASRAGRRLDRLVLKLEQDRDWRLWLDIDGRAMDQEAFGDAIEERLHTIVEPDQADLLQVIDNLRVTSSGHFESRIARANGSVVLDLHDDHQVSAGQLRVPEVIRFAVPIYDGGSRYQLDAWLRVRVASGKLTLHVKLKPYRPTVLAAWRDVLGELQAILGDGTDRGEFTILEA